MNTSDELNNKIIGKIEEKIRPLLKLMMDNININGDRLTMFSIHLEENDYLKSNSCGRIQVSDKYKELIKDIVSSVTNGKREVRFSNCGNSFSLSLEAE